MTFPEASFLALNTHLDPITLAPGGTCSSVQVPVVCRVASSSWIACSHRGQSGLHFTSPRLHGLSTLESAVSAAKATSNLTQLSCSAGKPASTDHAPPTMSAALASSPSSKLPGTETPLGMAGSEWQVEVTPTPA